MLASELFKSAWKAADVEIKGIEIDSRKVRDGYVFICISGMESDGHDFAKSAEANGAAAIVSQKPLDVKIPVIEVTDTLAETAVLASRFYGEPEKKLKLVGITGTNGKTTVSYLVKQILESAGKKVGIIGTNDILVGDQPVDIKSSTPTTPNSLELHRIFAKMLDMGAEYAVMEVSSHALELHRVDGLHYDAAVFTNLTQDHLDYHKTMENYFAAKKKLFDISDAGIINIDDEYGARLAEDIPCRAVSVGTNNSVFCAGDIEIDAKGVRFCVNVNGEKYAVRLGISGMFSVYNALCAIAAASAVGIDMQTICRALESASGVKGRLELVPTDTEYSVIIDYAHTPDGLENVLNAVNAFKKGRCIAVFGCGGDRDSTKRPIMGEIGARLADLAVITSDNPRTEDPEKIVADVAAGVKTGDYKIIVNRRDAIKYALSIAEKDDIVLLAGKGQETYQIIGKEKTHFDEREVVHEILHSQN